jgi:hypothetical protein
MGASVGTGGNGASEDEVLLQVGSPIRHVDAKAIVLIDRQQRRRETRRGPGTVVAQVESVEIRVESVEREQ